MNLSELEVLVEHELRRLAADVTARVKIIPPDFGRSTLRGAVTLGVTFLRTAQDETLDVTVTLRPTEQGVQVSADLVQGGTGHVYLDEPERLIADLPSLSRVFSGFFEKCGEILFAELQERQ